MTTQATDHCPTCKKLTTFIQAMADEFDSYKTNKTALYYKGQCNKVLEQVGPPPQNKLNKPVDSCITSG